MRSKRSLPAQGLSVYITLEREIIRIVADAISQLAYMGVRFPGGSYRPDPALIAQKLLLYLIEPVEYVDMGAAETVRVDCGLNALVPAYLATPNIEVTVETPGRPMEPLPPGARYVFEAKSGDWSKAKIIHSSTTGKRTVPLSEDAQVNILVRDDSAHIAVRYSSGERDGMSLDPEGSAVLSGISCIAIRQCTCGRADCRERHSLGVDFGELPSDQVQWPAAILNRLRKVIRGTAVTPTRMKDFEYTMLGAYLARFGW